MEVYYFTEVEHYRIDGKALFYGESYLLMSIFTTGFCLISPKILTIYNSYVCGGGGEISKQARLKYEAYTCVHTKENKKHNRSRIHERTISLRFLSIILRVLRLRFPYTMFTLQTSLKPLLLKTGGGGGVKIQIHCPKYVQEFGLRTGGGLTVTANSR
jgi:hypothetical protein